ncbi:MAG: glycoside hydrolase family 2 protein [Bacteroidetes bacterium]|nr:MAG: glycoside hydrolase family 2 protein [Bacteroidota bacterium]
MNIRFLLCCLVGVTPLFWLSLPAQPIRLTQSLNQGWAYLPQPIAHPSALPAEGWQTINLPHTWNQWDATDLVPGYRRDASWYRKELLLSPEPGRRYLLRFEAANMKAKVFVNGHLAGSHVGGYLGFVVDLTPWLVAGTNTLAIRVDNGYDPNLIPSQKADFFLYGGITRDLWLDVVSGTYLQELQVWTLEVSARQARTRWEVTLNQVPSSPHQLRVRLYDPAGAQVAEQWVKKGEQTHWQGELPVLSDPLLWSPDRPQLYTLEVDLLMEGQVVDRQQRRIGYRWYAFEPHGAFYLNGQRLKLRGTHRHEEHAGYGAAMPDSLHRRDMRLIKEMGANFVRLGHYPQDPSVYDACDSLGIIVWDELPWCRGGMGGEVWQAQTKRLLQEQIRQHRHHPSIFFWSLGNEVYWLPDFPGGDDTTRLNAFVRELHELAHELDPGRLTAMRKYYAGASIPDVFSPSIWSGWYAGVYTNYQSTLEKQRPLYPALLHMEYGGSSHVGRHSEKPITGSGLLPADEWTEVSNQVDVKNVARSGDWSENYIVDLFDWHLQVSETLDWFPGNAQWAFKDFGTPLRPENAIPYINQKGLLDRSGLPKDAYYVFKSYWATIPFAYIESHTWTERMGPPGEEREVCVYSNAEAVELWLNGTSLGRKTRQAAQFPAAGLQWPLLFAEGPNQLVARAYRGGQVVATDSLRLIYHYDQPGKPDHIRLSSSPLPNGNLLIEAVMVDAEGRRVLDYEARVYFAHDGAGQLLAHYGTPTRSQVIEFANGYAAIEFVPGPGPAVIEARNQDFKGSYLRYQPGD